MTNSTGNQAACAASWGTEMIFDYDGLKLRPVFVMTRALIGCEHADGGGMQSCDDCELFEECPMLDMGENAPERCTTGRGSTGDPGGR